MSFEHIGDISKRVLRKAWLRKHHPDVFILPETEGGRFLLKEALKDAFPNEMSCLHETNFDEDYRQHQIDYKNYLHTIGQPVDGQGRHLK